MLTSNGPQNSSQPAVRISITSWIGRVHFDLIQVQRTWLLPRAVEGNWVIVQSRQDTANLCAGIHPCKMIHSSSLLCLHLTPTLFLSREIIVEGRCQIIFQRMAFCFSETSVRLPGLQSFCLRRLLPDPLMLTQPGDFRRSACITQSITQSAGTLAGWRCSRKSQDTGMHLSCEREEHDMCPTNYFSRDIPSWSSRISNLQSETCAACAYSLPASSALNVCRLI